MFAIKRKEKIQPGRAIIIIDRPERMVVSRRKMWNHYSTCNDDDFLGPLSRNCQFCILSRYHRTHYKSQTPTASHPCPPGLALQCSPGGWCPLVPSQPCVGNSKGTGHLRQTTVASSSSSFRPKTVFIINWCYKEEASLRKLSFIFPTHLLHQPSLSLRGEESVHQVIVGFVRNFERLLLDVSEDGVQHVRWEIFPREMLIFQIPSSLIARLESSSDLILSTMLILHFKHFHF